MKKIIIQKLPDPEHTEALAHKIHRRAKIKAIVVKTLDILYRGFRPRH